MQILVETFHNHGEPSTAPVRVRPVAGQAYSASMRVECSRSRRQESEPGRYYLLEVQVKSAPGKDQWLYSYYGDPWREISSNEATDFLAASSQK